jgi:hypothetical protein
MKSEGKIKQKLKDAKFKYLKRELRSKLRKCPENCQYNVRHNVTSYHYVEGSDKPEKRTVEVGLCMYGSENPEEWSGKICDEDKTAQDCGLFLGKFDKEEVKAQFNSKLEDDALVAEEYKDLAALQWVVGDSIVKWEMPWHQKIWYALLYQMYRLGEVFKRSGLGG